MHQVTRCRIAKALHEPASCCSHCWGQASCGLLDGAPLKACQCVPPLCIFQHKGPPAPLPSPCVGILLAESSCCFVVAVDLRNKAVSLGGRLATKSYCMYCKLRSLDSVLLHPIFHPASSYSNRHAVAKCFDQFWRSEHAKTNLSKNRSHCFSSRASAAIAFVASQVNFHRINKKSQMQNCQG